MLGLEAWPQPRGLSTPKFCGLGLGLEGPGLGLGLEGPGLVRAGLTEVGALFSKIVWGPQALTIMMWGPQASTS